MALECRTLREFLLDLDAGRARSVVRPAATWKRLRTSSTGASTRALAPPATPAGREDLVAPRAARAGSPPRSDRENNRKRQPKDNEGRVKDERCTKRRCTKRRGRRCPGTGRK